MPKETNLNYKCYEDYANVIPQKRFSEPEEQKEAVIKTKTMLREFGGFFKNHRQLGQMLTEKRRGRSLSIARQKRLLKNALKSEKHFDKGLDIALRLLQSRKDLKQIQEGVLENFEDFRLFSSPVFYPPVAQKAIQDLGVRMKDMRYYHNLMFNKRNAPYFKAVFEADDFTDLIKEAKKAFKKRKFPESEEMLREIGLVTIEGGSDPTPYIVGAVAVVVAVVVSFYFPPLIPIAVPVGIAGAKLLGEELVQDATNNQDGEWEFGPIKVGETKFKFDDADYERDGDLREGNTQGDFYANVSSSKMEVHRVNCPWLHLVSNKNIRVYSNIESAHQAGMDNCHWCIGDSRR